MANISERVFFTHRRKRHAATRNCGFHYNATDGVNHTRLPAMFFGPWDKRLNQVNPLVAFPHVRPAVASKGEAHKHTVAKVGPRPTDLPC